jgi:hypothetical protein
VNATWKRHNLRLTPAFVLALLFGGIVRTAPLNPNQPSDVSALDAGSLQLIVDEGRRQLDNQADRFRHITDRAQTLLTVGLIAVGFAASIFTRLGHVHAVRRVLATSFWGVGGVMLLIGIAAAAAAVVVGAEFDTVDTTQISGWPSPALPLLAREYAEAVIIGETTVAARLTLFRQATRFVCWGVVLAALAVVMTS